MSHCHSRRRQRCAIALIALGQIVVAQTATAANASQGFADYRLGVSESLIDGNVILRRPFFVVGASYEAWRESSEAAGFGGLVRPSLEPTGGGEFILGGNYFSRAGTRQWEVQAKFIAPNGLGFSAGFVEAGVADELWFASAVARGKRGTLNYQLSVLAQSGADGISPGGYAALHGEHLFVGGGSDGEHWRVLGSWSANNSSRSAFDPSIEFLLVDHTIGRLAGEKFQFVNGSLKRNTGFLSTASRLGRALGPQGLQFANPVTFLSQPWSRTADVWEIGEIVNVRFARRMLPDGAVSALAQAVIFPMQALKSESRYRGLFAGIQYQREVSRSTSLLFGHARRLGPASVNVAGSFDLDRRSISGSLGIRLYF